MVMRMDLAVKGYLTAVVAGYVILCSTLILSILR